jgi:UDP-galactopyranose mutase
MAYDVLIVGAGFSGAVLAERLASQLDRTILIIDRRDHICGNANDTTNEFGVRIHTYGPHLFHTNDLHVVEYLSQFTEWRPYEHRVLSHVDGKLVPMPVNRTTINALFGLDLKSEEEIVAFLDGERVSVPHVLTSEDFVLAKAGRRLYEKLYRGYSRKHWGVDPAQLSPQVCGRLPIRVNTDDRYFDDRYQLMPLEGYHNMFQRMLDHPNIEVRTGVDFRSLSGIRWKHVIYTGPIDEYFDHRYGKLPYRSLYFTYESHRAHLLQPVGQINYPNDFDYTRSIEYKHITGQGAEYTTIAFEHPSDEGEPFYPVPSTESRSLYSRYRKAADSLNDVTFAGRLGTYKYLNMDQVVAQSLTIFNRVFQ